MRAANLSDRDVYQVYLRGHPERRSGINFSVQWKISDKKAGRLKIKLEIRGGQKNGAPQQMTLEAEVKPTGWITTWSSLRLLGEPYKNFGELTAWRATLWEGDTLLDEQKSFLW